MKSKRANYKSYLLRLWREDGRGQWHASLQSTATEQTMHFADLAILLAFLESEVPKVAMDAPNEKSLPSATPYED